MDKVEGHIPMVEPTAALDADIPATDHPAEEHAFLDQLASRYAVSRETVVAALEQLRSSSDHSPELLAQLLRDRIADGTYRLGEPLPKAGFFAREYGIPKHAVTRAVAALAQEGLVCRSGQSWIVGSERRRGLRTYPPYPPVILVVGSRESSWADLGRQERTTSFCRSFNEELERNGILQMPVTPNSRFDTCGSAVGLEALPALASDLGDRYRGTLIAATLADIPKLGSWAKACLDLGKPVVWFDRYNNEAPKEPVQHENFLHCHFDEEAALRLALDFLAQMGHRTAGYGYPFRWGSWERVRGERLQRLAPKVCSDFTFVVPPALERLAPKMDTPPMREMITRFMREPSAVQEDIRYFLERMGDVERIMTAAGCTMNTESEISRIISLFTFVVTGGGKALAEIAGESQIQHVYLTPLFLHLLQDPDLTAVVAPNDAMARDLHRWLKAAGSSLGRELSLLSFDNYWALQPLPVTTIDFGFDNLGYAAYHFIQRDIPIKQHPKGHLAARPHVVRRGSVKPVL